MFIKLNFNLKKKRKKNGALNLILYTLKPVMKMACSECPGEGFPTLANFLNNL